MQTENEPLIDILIATYNGEKYIRTQLDSIAQQTYTNWHVTLRDDGSSDNTPTIAEEFYLQYPDKVTLLTNSNQNSGSVLNFSSLLSSAIDSSYIMFCDQDDKWLPGKIELTLKKMKELETIHGTNCPLLVFTDFLYVDEKLQPIASKKDFHVTRLKNVCLAHLFAQNHIYGCTMLMNAALAKLADPIPAEAENHDYWVAMVAASFGVVHYINQRTVLYRQHSRNVSGNFDNSSFKKRLLRNIVERRNFKDIIAKYAMLQVFTKRYVSHLPPNEKKTLEDFIRFYHHKNISMIIKNIKNSVRSQTFIQSLLIYISVLFVSKNKLPVKQ